MARAGVQLNSGREDAAGMRLERVSRGPVKCINMPDAIRRAALIRTDEDQISGNQRVSVEALLIAVIADVIAPPHGT